MKQKFKKIFPKLVSWILILMMVFTPSVIEVFAVGEGNMGSAGAQKGGGGEGQTINDAAIPGGTGIYDGAVERKINFSNDCDGYFIQGILLRLTTVTNVAKDNQAYQDYMAEYNQSLDIKSKISECQMSTIDKYLYDFPEEFSDNPSVIGNSALIFQRIKNKFDDPNKYGKPVGYRLSDGKVSNGYFQHVYDVNVDKSTKYTWFPTHLAYEGIVGDTTDTGNGTILDRLLRGELCYNDINPFIRTDRYEEAAKNILVLFEDTSQLSSCLGGVWTKAENAKDGLRRNIEDVYRLFYLDMLLAINYMCGSEYDDLIDIYLSSLNQNGADTFVIPIMADVIIIRSSGETDGYASTLPDYYGWITGKGANTFKAIKSLGGTPMSYLQREDDGREDLITHYSTATQNWWGKYENLKSTKFAVGALYAKARDFFWPPALTDTSQWNQAPWGNAFALLPTDCYGRATGNIGYTYLALGGGSGITPALPFKLTAQSSQTEVEPGSKVAATINIDLKQTNTSAVQNA